MGQQTTQVTKFVQRFENTVKINNYFLDEELPTPSQLLKSHIGKDKGNGQVFFGDNKGGILVDKTA